MAASVVLCFLPQAAPAAVQVSSMGVGITIASSASGSTKRLIVPAFVTTAAPPTSYTWNAAAISVRARGFKHPRRMEKSAALFWFEARRGGLSFRIAVSIASGKLVKIVPA